MEEAGTFNIEEELKKLPARPGVYLMRNKTDAVIYVGKARNLRNRVRQYFQSSRHKGAKIEQMVPHIRRFEYIVTDSESEALILECNLIKEYRPRYNTMLTDDKSYPFICVTVSEAYPRIFLTRNLRGTRTKNKFYGPYSDAGAVRSIIELLQRLYKIRSCSLRLPKDMGKQRPCLQYHIGRCDAPCAGGVSETAYGQNVARAMDFLNGRYRPVQALLKEKMQQAAEDLAYEKALEYRELLNSVAAVAEKQQMAGAGGSDRDIVALAADGQDAVAVVFFIRNGRMLGRDHRYLSVSERDTPRGILESFIKQYYAGTPYIPREISLPFAIKDEEAIQTWLSGRLGARVRLFVPQRGAKEKLLKLAGENADILLRQDKERLAREKQKTTEAVKEVAAALGLNAPPVRIEAYDISNTAGFASVGSMVVYENGVPKKNDYRKFSIKTIAGTDDYGSLQEVLTRRFTHGLKEQEDAAQTSFSLFPDLIMMDGGRGQVHAAEEIMDRLGLSIPVCGLVKDDKHRTRGLLYLDRECPLKKQSEGFRLITRIQDEAHRFAITYHRKRRGNAQIHSILDDIPGIGSVRRRALRGAYESLEEMKAASVEALSALPGMNRAAAESVYAFFHSKRE